MPKPIARYNYPPEKFPITFQLLSGKTGEVVWSRIITIDEASAIAKIEVPSFARTEHYPVMTKIRYADDTDAPAKVRGPKDLPQ